MSRFLIKQRVFSWTDTYYVYDEAGNPILFIKADWLSLGHRIRVFDNSTGEEIGIIQEKIFRIRTEIRSPTLRTSLTLSRRRSAI